PDREPRGEATGAHPLRRDPLPPGGRAGRPGHDDHARGGGRPAPRRRVGSLRIVSTSWPELGLPHISSGKVREIYDAGSGRLLMVTSDRITAFDVVMEERIPE